MIGPTTEPCGTPEIVSYQVAVDIIIAHTLFSVV